MEKESYFEKIESYIKPSIGLKAYLNYILREDKFKRKQILKISDKYFSSLLFISSGTLRLFSKEDNEDSTILFWSKNQLLKQMLMLSKYTGRELYVEFLEDSTIISFAEKHSPNLFKLFPEYADLTRRIYQAQVSELITHSTSLAKLSTNERYEELMKTNPNLFNICGLKIIANFLGIHPKVLSHLRAKGVKR